MTARQVVVGPTARRDLDGHARWLANEADVALAARFAKAAAGPFTRISEAPGIGSPIPSNNPALTVLRKWRVRGFPKLLIFYAPTSGGIRIIRVLPAAQDWMALLDTGDA